MEEIGGPAVEARSVSLANVLSPMSFKIFQGEGFGFLGPEGAGKTALIGLLSCATPRTGGSLYICGLDTLSKSRQIKEKIGIVPQGILLDEDFTSLDNLLLFCRYHRLSAKRSEERARGLLREMEMEEIADTPVSRLALPVKRRLMICRALLNEPVLLLLDKPTEGLEEEDKKWIWHLLNRLKKQWGLTLVTVSHDRHEIEILCDRVALLNRGEILRTGAPAEMVKEIVGPEVLEFFCRRGDMEYYLTRLKGRYRYQVLQNRVCLFLNETQEARNALGYISGEEMVIRRASLDDVFLKLAGRDLRKPFAW